MSEADEHDIARYWSGLAILERLSETGTGISSVEVAALLGARSVKGIGSAFSGTRFSLSEAGIRLDEAVHRRSVRGHTVWTAGPRIRQARHALEHARRSWTRRERQDPIPVEKAPPGYMGPVLVLRALKSREIAYQIDGAMSELDTLLEDDRFEIGDEGHESIGEVFINRIEPGHDARGQPVPEGYGENGIWVRGAHDYAQPRVAGAIGSGQYPTMIAWIGEAAWVERRIALVDAVRQVEEVRAEGWMLPKRGWRDVDEEKRFRYVNWIGARESSGPRSAPPLRMRLRCWYEIVIETEKRKRVVLREEGLRGDDARTASRAISRWRKAKEKHATAPVVVREVRIAKSQPRPMVPRETSRAIHTGKVPN